jgi:hypothetical protein
MTILFSLSSENSKHPFSPAFRCIFLNGSYDLLAGKLFKIAKYVRKVFIPGRSNQVYMIAHDTPAMQQQSFFLFNKNVSVFFPCKKLQSELLFYS